MKKSDHQKLIEADDFERIWVDVILLSFKHFIVYDYNLLSAHDTSKQIRIISQKYENEFPKEIIDAIRNTIYEPWDSNSILHNGYYDNRVGKEWFCGYGNLYHWRAGEEIKAQERVRKYIPKKLQKHIPNLQKRIALLDSDYCIPAFDLTRILGY